MGQVEELEDDHDIPDEWKHLPFKIAKSAELGRYLEATKDLKKGELIFKEAPLVVGPISVTPPVCLCCYAGVDGSYLCRKSGWPVCGPKCEKAVEKNPEVVIPHQTGKYIHVFILRHVYMYVHIQSDFN